ncbi:MAG: hypothetical protein JSS82_13505 [Bacteroidetes bacterium]|nr:hypothetical protein [Bacteroidota bacterium]
MSKKIFTLVLLLIAATHSFAVPGTNKKWYSSEDKLPKTYLRASVAYAMPLMRTNLIFTGIPSQSGVTNNNTFTQPQRASYMSGIQLRLAAGHMFNDYVGFELGAQTNVASGSYKLDIARNLTAPYGSAVQATTSTKLPTLITPAVVIQNTYDRVDAFAKFGLAIPILGNITTTAKTTGKPGDEASTYNSTAITKPQFFIGLYGGVGGTIHISESVKLFGELDVTALSLYAKETTITQYTVNGEDRLNTIPESQRTITYNTRDAQGNAIPKYVLPYSTFGFVGGISLRL